MVKLLLAELALRGRRSVVLLEFIPATERPGLRGRAKDLVWSVLLRRAVLRAQVLTRDEQQRYRRRFGTGEGQLVLVPWAGLADPAELPAAVPAVERTGVVMTGRDSCDWPTFLAAVRGQGWPVTVVCSAADLPQVTALAADDVVVRSEITAEEHWRLVSGAAVYAVALVETGHSAGQVRVMNAVSVRTPLVASRVSGLEGYLVDGVTAVAPGSVADLRSAVAELLADPGLRAARAEAAYEAAARRPWSAYLDEIRGLVRDHL